MRLRSNLGRASGIERPREVGRGAAAICRRRGGSRGGGLAGDAQTGAPGGNLTRAWVREVQGLGQSDTQTHWSLERGSGTAVV